MLAAFGVLPFYLGYWAVYRAPELRADPMNKRAAARLEMTEPGRLLSREGEEILGRSREGLGRWKREYPWPRTFCHLTGYAPNTGLQRSLRDALLAAGRYEEPWTALLRPERVGDDVQLTISAPAQKLARRLLEGQRGAVVALDPRAGQVLVLASAPTYDPVEIAANPATAELFRTDPSSPELNRALQGLYPPGSIFKLITAAAGLESGRLSLKTTYDCPGRVKIGGHELGCWKRGGHGRVDLARALEVSCNVYFAHVGETLGAEELSTYARTTGLFALPPLPLPAMAGRLVPRKTDAAASASMAVGQADLMVTPFSAAQLAAVVANGGQLMRPALVQAVVSPEGRAVKHLEPVAQGQAFRPDTARLLAGMMAKAVESGTGQAAQLPRIRVAGKTGSAEGADGAAHAWFVGFAPADDPRVAVAVLIEHGGTGGGAAAPIARDIMAELLR
jgi:peptidoglycan glycosyltransferase